MNIAFDIHGQAVMARHVEGYARSYLAKRYPNNNEIAQLMADGVDEGQKRGIMDAWVLLAYAISHVNRRLWYEGGGKTQLIRLIEKKAEYDRVLREAQRRADSIGAAYVVTLIEGRLWQRILGHFAHALALREEPPRTVEWYISVLAQIRKSRM